MGNKGYVNISGFCEKCKKRTDMRNVKVKEEKTKRGLRNIAIGVCACGTAMRKIMPAAILMLALAGCGGFYIEKHLTIEGDGIRVPYGLTSIKGDKIKLSRDVYFGCGDKSKKQAETK